jgi:hypothetical protein
MLMETCETRSIKYGQINVNVGDGRKHKRKGDDFTCFPPLFLDSPHRLFVITEQSFFKDKAVYQFLTIFSTLSRVV